MIKLTDILNEVLETVNETSNDKILVYHGTNAEFTDFDKNLQNSVTGHGDFGKGFYFTRNKNVAKYYTLKSKENRILITTYVSIRNPFIIDIDNEKFSPETTDRYNKLRYLQDYQRETIRKYADVDTPFGYKKITKELTDGVFSRILDDNDYDGVIVNRTLGGDRSEGAEIVVFDKSQIGKLEVERL